LALVQVRNIARIDGEQQLLQGVAQMWFEPIKLQLQRFGKLSVDLKKGML
jgi:hypothetical protein